MEAGHCQESRYRRMVVIYTPVGQDQDVDSLGDGVAGLPAQLVHGTLQARPILAGLEEDWQRHRFEVRPIDVPELLQFLVGQDRVFELDLPAILRLGHQEIPLGAEHRFGGRDDLLANGVDGWVGDLGEQLFEVVVEQLWPVG